MNDFYTITRGNGGVIAWTDDQVAYILDRYINQNYTLKQLGREFNCSYGTIRNLLHKHHCESRGCKQGYPRNEFYFHCIDTSEKAYWLGFLYADGAVASHTSAIGITLTDEEHVEKFKTAIGAINHKIVAEHSKNFPNAKTLYHLEVKDKQLHKDLVELGCIPNKSLNLTKIPNIPRDYVSHFIRGYFDGDGSLHYLKGTNNYRISFIGTFDFLNDIQKELQTNVSLHYGSSGTAYMLQISGRKQVERVLNYIYQDSTESMRLNRKYQTYLNCLQWAHRN